MTDRTASSSLETALATLRRRWWALVLVPALLLGIALVYTLTATKQYEATSRLLLRESGVSAALVGVPDTQPDDPQREAATNLELIASNAVADRAARRLGERDAEGLLDAITVSASPDADLVDVTATDTDPRRAAAVANAFAAGFVAFRRETDRATIVDGERQLRRRLEELGGEGDAAERRQLEAALQRVIALSVVQTGNVEVVDRASVPGDPASPNLLVNLAVALGVGALLGIALAFLLEALDRRIESSEDLEELYGLTVLAGVPAMPRQPKTDRERAAALEPFRILRNGLKLPSGEDPRVVVVTSAVPGEGKSTVASGLARATALSGRAVALVEADLRRPTMADRLELRGNTRGLTTALVGGVPVSQLLRRPLPALGALAVLPSGPLPPNAAELLRSDELGQVLRDLLDEVDLVVLDAPPLLPVADSQVLLDRDDVDAAIVVARTGVTQRDHVRRARLVLDGRRVKNVSLVTNALKDRASRYDYYDTREAGAKGTRARSGLPG